MTPLFNALVKGPTLRFIEIDVANLWRLQAQKDPLEIEVGIAGGGSARASVSAQGLWGALSPAARIRLGLEELPSSAQLLGALDPYYGQTMRLFDYPALADLFAAELVPWQVAVRRKPCIYWPTHLTALGRP